MRSTIVLTEEIVQDGIFVHVFLDIMETTVVQVRTGNGQCCYFFTISLLVYLKVHQKARRKPFTVLQ